MFGPSLSFVLLLLSLAWTPTFYWPDLTNRKISDSSDTVPHAPENSAQSSPAGRALFFDRSFQDKYGVYVPIPFELTLPTATDAIIDVEFPKRDLSATGRQAYARILFASYSTGLYSTLDIFPMAIERQARLRLQRQMAHSTLPQAFSQLTRNHVDAAIQHTKAYRLGHHSLVVLSGTYSDPERGLVDVRVYGVIPQRSKHGLLLFERRRADRTQGDNGLAEQVIRSLRFP
ncbi:MAG: hypothetical protein AAFY99_05120 [Pseudomonadota bacterium]